MRSSITILFLMLIVSFVSASPVETPADAVYNVYYKSTEAGSVKVTILNDKNKVVFSEVIHASGFKRPYNFRELPEGEYTVVIAGKNGEQVQKISHKLVRKQDAAKSLIRVAALPGTDGKYLMTVANSSAQSVWVRIYHNSGLVHEEKIAVNGSAAQIYNL